MMNGRVAKKIRKYSRRQFLEYVAAVRKWPFRARLRFAWLIVKGD
jgi:hypothetical protein